MALEFNFARFGSSLIAATLVLIFARTGYGNNPRVVVADIAENDPSANEVIEILRKHLVELEIDIDTHGMAAYPNSVGQWQKQASLAAKSLPGTILLIGYTCNDKKCEMVAVDPISGGRTTIPVRVPDHDDLTTAFALAATAREIILGPLVPELSRLARHGKNPGPPPPSPESIWMQPPLEDARKTVTENVRPWFWIEGGYMGDHPHPEGKPNHGLYLGGTLEPRPVIGLHLAVGWLGMRHKPVDPYEVVMHRLTASFAMRVMFALGPAHVSIAPLVRFDTVFSNIEDQESTWKLDKTDLEIQAGAVTQWHLPISRRAEVTVGAGLLFSVLARDTKDDTVLVVPASDIRFLWTAGIAFSPL